MPKNRISFEINTAGGSALVWKRRPKTCPGFKAEIETGQGSPVAESAAGGHGEARAGGPALFSAVRPWASQAMDMV